LPTFQLSTEARQNFLSSIQPQASPAAAATANPAEYLRRNLLAEILGAGVNCQRNWGAICAALVDDVVESVFVESELFKLSRLVEKVSML
jgi:hypothetical protein